jgi:putative ABC transport system substrate-binding protein
MMKRREFVGLIGAAAVTWPRTVRAQQTGGIKRVAALIGGSDNDPAVQKRMGMFGKALANKNWVEGGNLRTDVRWGGSDAARTQALAKELVELAPDVILATNTPTARALKQATETIPVVFAGLSDPIADGIVTNLSKPERNFTGFTSFNAAIAGKWLQLLKEISPGIRHTAIIYNPSTAPHAIFLPVMRSVAPQIGVSLLELPVADKAAIEDGLGKFASAADGGLVVMPDVFTTLHRETIFGIANRNRLPTVSPLRQFAAAGSLVSYGSNFDDLFVQAASYVDRILRGEKPGDLPVQEPTRYELIVNLKTARAIGLEMPPSLLATADEVIE